MLTQRDHDQACWFGDREIAIRGSTALSDELLRNGNGTDASSTAQSRSRYTQPPPDPRPAAATTAFRFHILRQYRGRSDAGDIMSQTFNIYCDESCHLENDHQPVMLLGAIWCPQDEVERLSKEIQDMKARHRAAGELKWSKVSKARLGFYLELVSWFIAEAPLHFRGLVVLNKERLDHKNSMKVPTTTSITKCISRCSARS